MLRSLLKYRSLWSSKYLDVVLSVRHCSNSKKSSNAVELVEFWRQKFTELQIPEVKSSLDNILGCVLKQRKVYGLSERRDLILTQEEVNEFNRLCHCREARMPIQYIVGEWEFRDLHLKMQPPVFIPRPETEGLVELILKKNKSTEFVRFLEIGCGSGAVSLALLSALPNAKCKAVDQSSMACFLTLKNAISLKLSDRISVFQHKVTDEIKDEDFCEKFDFIVSNPPYVPTRDLLKIDPEIRLYEDLRALDGGEDGLNVIKSILRVASKFLKDNGTLWLEVDSSHPQVIEDYLNIHHKTLQLKFLASHRDIFNKERFIEIRKDL